MNPNAWRRNAFSYEEVAESQMVCDPLRKYMFCSPAEGGCAMILCRADKAREYHLKSGVPEGRQRQDPQLRLVRGVHTGTSTRPRGRTHGEGFKSRVRDGGHRT